MTLLSPDIIRLLQNVCGFIIYISFNHCLSLENKDIYIYGIIKEIVTLFILTSAVSISDYCSSAYTYFNSGVHKIFQKFRNLYKY
jgi:hypothetical protein